MCATISLIIAVASVFSGIGLFTMCLCKAASDADDIAEDMYNQE